MNGDAYFKYEISRLKLKKYPCFQSDNGGFMRDTEKGKQKTKLLSDPKNYNHNI